MLKHHIWVRQKIVTHVCMFATNVANGTCSPHQKPVASLQSALYLERLEDTCCLRGFSIPAVDFASEATSDAAPRRAGFCRFLCAMLVVFYIGLHTDPLMIA